MADFFQNGVVTTLQDLGNRSLEDMEKELEEFGKRRKMVLLLPALYSEFETPAMHKIIEELKGVKYLYKIILGLDQATKEQFEEVKKLMSVLPCKVDVLWNDGPRIKELYNDLTAEGFPGLNTPGKGRNVWTMLGYGLTDKDAYAFALHDCDIVTYTREVPARLFYPIVHPALDLEFNKGFYSRVTNKLHGRATRLLYTPLINSLKKVYGTSKYLDYMESFRYALSGEFSFIRSLGRGIGISPTWGLEVSTLSEVYKNTSNRRICQTEIMESYEHKHQDLGSANSGGGIYKMANDIAKTIFRIMAQEGVIFSVQSFKTLLATYFQESRFEISKYNALSKLNGLEYNREKEIKTVEAFQEAIKEAAEEFYEDPMGVPSMSPWITVRSVMPEFSDKFKEYVKEDNK
ncbi:glycosyl transferase [Malaciobacter pacificus]|jgi:glucosyl-3-phosphoglycerate synthase|uniref:Mannosyl-3-phosphoglycerate synthase n=1 Tax=Malaciobacter pacificus TaxID=1080223 RepID=A0A5C2H9S2_9BACT|nr:glycosyl transferase [Malaciobacter pacificus]QEP35089.1 mannosyl-3-phosphoglycerate synthase [Malaciobacter pacificus]GGD36779.1 glycosyl transferase [Malaciobacter pacificus]